MESISLIKYEQDCFVIKTRNDKYFIFDPGSESSVDQFLDGKKPEAIFISHAHPDHFNIEKIKLFNCPVYAPIEIYDSLHSEYSRVYKIAPDIRINLDILSVDPFLVDHGVISAPIVNLGFHITSSNKSILFLGDIAHPSPIPNSKYDIILIPVGGSKVFDPTKAYEFIRSINYTGTVVPMHYHGRADRTSGLQFKNIANSFCNVVIMDVNESITI